MLNDSNEVEVINTLQTELFFLIGSEHSTHVDWYVKWSNTLSKSHIHPYTPHIISDRNVNRCSIAFESKCYVAHDVIKLLRN